MNEMMNNEQKLVVNCSRLTIGNKVEEIKRLAQIKDLKWEKVIEYGLRNKVLYMVAYNLERLGINEMPEYFKKLILDGFVCNEIKNEQKLNEMKRICKRMREEGIEIAPVKGAYLIDNLYQNRKIRTTNDMDALIRKDDIHKIHRIMLDMGYIDDFYDIETKAYKKYSTRKRMLYKTKMYNLLPYVKVVPGVLETVIMFDFSFALDFTLDTYPVKDMITCADVKDGVRILRPEHYFIHMCCHHYREASHTEWIRLGKDLNLIKFCDVREFVLKLMNEKSMVNALMFAEEYDLIKPVYFTIYFLKEIYHDGYEDKLLDRLNIDNQKFLFEFGENEYAQVQMRKKEFWDSFFDENNISEIVDSPKYEELNS